MLSPCAIFTLKIHLNAFAAGASLGPLGLTALPKPPSWFSAGRGLVAEENRKGEAKGGKRKGEGVGTFRHFSGSNCMDTSKGPNIFGFLPPLTRGVSDSLDTLPAHVY